VAVFAYSTLFLDSRVAGLDGLKVPISDLVRNLASFTQTTVQDKTGLAGTYDANLQTALQQQLGLKLEPHSGPVELLIIDHAERPGDSTPLSLARGKSASHSFDSCIGHDSTRRLISPVTKSPRKYHLWSGTFT
jgi:hypothetical protein